MNNYRPLTIIPVNAKRLRNTVYQREIDERRVKEIVDHFSMAQLNPLKVILSPDGMYDLVDGQHTFMAMKQKFGENINIMCTVIDKREADDAGLTTEQFGAKVFAHQLDNTKTLSINEKFKAAFIAGEQEAVNIIKICDNNEFELNFTTKSSGKNIILCTKCLMDIYEKPHGAKLLDRTLAILRSAYNGSSDSLVDKYIRVIATFIQKFDDDINYSDKKLETILKKSKNSPAKILEDAKIRSHKSLNVAGIHMTIDKCLLDIILELYNKGKLRENRLLYSVYDE